jgi:hypothetical protein
MKAKKSNEELLKILREKKLELLKWQGVLTDTEDKKKLILVLIILVIVLMLAKLIFEKLAKG